MSGIEEIFLGIGFLLVMMCIAGLFYQFIRYFRCVVNKEEKYELVEELKLKDYAQKKLSIDLDKELIKNKIFKNKKNFRKKLEEEIFDEFFLSKNIPKK